MDAQLRVLNLSRDCTVEQVRKAYHVKALQLHPDRDCGNAAAFQRVQTAYEEVLTYVKQRNGGPRQFFSGRSTAHNKDCKDVNSHTARKSSSHTTARSTTLHHPPTHSTAHRNTSAGHTSTTPSTHSASPPPSCFSHTTRHATPPRATFHFYPCGGGQASFTNAPCRPVSPLLTEQELFADMAPPSEPTYPYRNTTTTAAAATTATDDTRAEDSKMDVKTATCASTNTRRCEDGKVHHDDKVWSGGRGASPTGPPMATRVFDATPPHGRRSRTQATPDAATPPQSCRHSPAGDAAVSVLRQKWASVNEHIRCKLEATSRSALAATATAAATARRLYEETQVQAQQRHDSGGNDNNSNNASNDVNKSNDASDSSNSTHTNIRNGRNNKQDEKLQFTPPASERVYAGSPLRFVHSCRASQSRFHCSQSGQGLSFPHGVEQTAFDERMSAAELHRGAVASEQHRDSILAERRLLQSMALQHRFCPAPDEVGAMSDSEVYTLTRLLRESAGRVQRVLEGRLRRGLCSRCEHESKSSALSNEDVFACHHACVCVQCARCAVMCPLCGASRRGGVHGEQEPAEADSTVDVNMDEKDSQDGGGSNDQNYIRANYGSSEAFDTHTGRAGRNDDVNENGSVHETNDMCGGHVGDGLSAYRPSTSTRIDTNCSTEFGVANGRDRRNMNEGVRDTRKSRACSSEGSSNTHSGFCSCDDRDGEETTLSARKECDSSTSTISLTGIITSVAQRPCPGVAAPL